MGIKVKCNADGCENEFENPTFGAPIVDGQRVMFDIGKGVHICDNCILLAHSILTKRDKRPNAQSENQ
jgi:hypothetical protein